MNKYQLLLGEVEKQSTIIGDESFHEWVCIAKFRGIDEKHEELKDKTGTRADLDTFNEGGVKHLQALRYVLGIKISDIPQERTNCFCHTPIKWNFVIFNKINRNIMIVGSECIRHVEGENYMKFNEARCFVCWEKLTDKFTKSNGLCNQCRNTANHDCGVLALATRAHEVLSRSHEYKRIKGRKLGPNSLNTRIFTPPSPPNPVFTFGKYKGQFISKVFRENKSYFTNWMVKQYKDNPNEQLRVPLQFVGLV